MECPICHSECQPDGGCWTCRCGWTACSCGLDTTPSPVQDYPLTMQHDDSIFGLLKGATA